MNEKEIIEILNNESIDIELRSLSGKFVTNKYIPLSRGKIIAKSILDKIKEKENELIPKYSKRYNAEEELGIKHTY